MAENELTQLIESTALRDLNPRDSITRIKAAAIRQFQALDSRMKIYSTEYFNHSFAPDLVLIWQNGQETERYVYMRSDSNHDDLADDVERLGRQKPIVLGLNRVHENVRQLAPPQIVLNRLAQDRDTLVTDPVALASVVDAKRNNPIAGLFSTALAQAGRGLVDSADAEVTTETIATGFDAAREMGADSVLRAVITVDDHLATPFASKFNRILEAVWIGSGGRADLFPLRGGNLDLAAGVDDEALEFLLDLGDVEDYEFWRRIGRTASVSQIAKLSPRQPNDNLQRLIKANLDHLTARVTRVQDRQQQLDQQNQPDLWWLTENGALALRSHSWIAFVAEKAEDLGRIEGTSTDGVSISDLIECAGNTVLTGVEMSDGIFELDLSSSTQANVTRSNHLTAVAQSFGPAARVQRAKAMTDSRQISCDFAKSSASTTTSSVVPLTELLGTSLPLLRPMSPAERASLLELISPLADPNQLPLPDIMQLSFLAADRLELPSDEQHQDDAEDE